MNQFSPPSPLDDLYDVRVPLPTLKLLRRLETVDRPAMVVLWLGERGRLKSLRVIYAAEEVLDKTSS